MDRGCLGPSEFPRNLAGVQGPAGQRNNTICSSPHVSIIDGGVLLCLGIPSPNTVAGDDGCACRVGGWKKKKKSPGPGVRRMGNYHADLRALRAMEQSHSTAISCYDNH